jgi:hypothetical protein
MKMVKSLLLGSAAGLVAIAGAQAADLPVKAKPVQYVKICSLYGVGFYYIPGTDMCIKVGGWARFETGTGYNGSFTSEFFDNNPNNRNTINFHYRVKGTATFDARDQTEYGTVRSYIALGISTNDTYAPTGTANYANRWFIQWAGFTLGKATSFYDFYSIGANQYGFVTASSDSGDGGWEVVAYTANFGNGLSASLSAEEQRTMRLVNTNVSSGVAFGATAGNYAAMQMPDFVANLRVDQAWGSAQIMGAIHEINANYYTPGAEGSGYPSDATGFAVGAGIKLNAPMIGHGDYLQAEVDYTEGASRYSNMTAFQWDYVKYDGNTVGFGYETDGVFGGTVAAGTASGIELTTTWAVNAAYTHFWNPAWKTTLWGSYRAVSYNDQANAMICNGQLGLNLGTAAPNIAGCDMNWDAWGLGLRTEWAVSHTFQIGLEVLYANLDSAQEPTGTVTAGGSNGKPAGTYTISDQDQWAVRLRVNRAFYP